ncbi:MAG: hypothetical protein EA397_19600 [Deltaproteobacteria bacterium]|nr:MAG: hypothetical protein EA397_19600 [Deltaproteobacteria bacterium]
MDSWEPGEVAAAVAVGLAVLQWLASPWRDVGATTLCAAGVALAFSGGFPSSFTAVLLAVALVLGAVAWARGARHGVGRPGLAGVGLAAMALGLLSPFLLPDVVPPGPRERLVEATLVLIGLCGAVSLPLALERPGPRRPRPFFLRRVPVGLDGRPPHEPSAEVSGGQPTSEPV